MIAPNRAVFSTEPQRSVTEALLKRVAKNPPSGLTVGELGEDAPGDPEQQGVDVEQPGDQHQAEETRARRGS